MNIIPKVNPQDVAGVFALMAFLADKDASMKRLKELSDAVVAAEAEQQLAAETTQAADKDRAEVGKALDAARSDKLAAAALHDVTQVRAAEVDARTAELALAEKALVKRAADVDERQAELNKAHSDLVERARLLKVEEHGVAALKTEYENKLQAMRNLAK